MKKQHANARLRLHRETLCLAQSLPPGSGRLVRAADGTAPFDPSLGLSCYTCIKRPGG